MNDGEMRRMIDMARAARVTLNGREVKRISINGRTVWERRTI